MRGAAEHDGAPSAVIPSGVCAAAGPPAGISSLPSGAAGLG